MSELKVDKELSLENQREKVPSISERARSMQASPLRKLGVLAEERKNKGVKIYYLNIGQPDLPTDPAVFSEIQKREQKTIAYAPSNGMAETLTAWRMYFKNFGIEFTESEMIVTAGGSEAVIFAMCSICDTNDEIIVFEPFYTNYNGFATLANVKLKAVPLSIENGFHLPSADEIEKYITPKTKGILLNNPSNPTGAIYSRKELEGVVQLIKKHNLFLMCDEVYREFAYDAEFISVMDFPEIAQQTILIDSCSKRFNVCGARIGVIASHNKEVIQSSLKFGMARLSVATIEQLAVIPLLTEPQKFTQPIVEEFRKRRDVVYECLKEIPGVTFYKPEGAFYIVIGLPVKDSEHFSKWLIEEFEYDNETILLAPAQGFYASPNKGMNEVRLAFMLNVEEMKKCLNILKIALQNYQRKFE